MPPKPKPPELARLLDVDRLGEDLFQSRINESNINGVIYGGQVLGQSLWAATQTVAGRPVHSMHACFLRPGRMDQTIRYRVDRTREGRTLSTRRVIALQDDVPIFHMEASFHHPEPGFAHQSVTPAPSPPPEALPTPPEIAKRYGEKFTRFASHRLFSHPSIEIRPVRAESLFERGEVPRNAFWLRIPGAVDFEPALHACALAYASDAGLISSVVMTHVAPLESSGVRIASLDHAIWFHAPAQTHQWHLYELESPWAGAGRGLGFGRFYDRDGKLMASLAQEALMRIVAPAESPKSD